MQYFFCVDIPWENTYIDVYNSFEELKKVEELYMKNNNDWYIIKGEVIDLDLNERR